MGARDRLRKHFLSTAGKVLTSDQLRKVGGISEWARRVRELRDQEGYQILTNNDDASLKPGEYKLVDPKPRPAFDAHISNELREFNLDWNEFTCQMCGATAGDPDPYEYNRKIRLHIGYIVDKSMGGTDEPGNLRALCSVCNEGVRSLALDRPTQRKLLIQMRRATGADQLGVLGWLIGKYPTQAAEQLKRASSPKSEN